MKTDKEKHKLQGPVKTVQVESSQFVENGENTEGFPFIQTTTFNRDGWIIELVSQNPDGSKCRMINDYSETGKLIAVTSYDNSDAPIWKVKYIYDDKGRLKAEQYEDRDGKITTPTTYIYDSEGKLKIQEFSFIEDPGIIIGMEGTASGIFYAGRISRSETRYNDQGEEIELKVFNDAEALVGQIEVTRDAQGNIVEETLYTGNNVEFSPFAPDSEAAKEGAAMTEEQKREAERILALMFAPGAVMSKRIHKYNESGKLIETRETMMGMETNRQTFAYGEDGNKSEVINYYGNGFESKTIFTREFDEYGNWIKKAASSVSISDAETEPKNVVNVTRRTITYY
jgi:hypothetical protein